METGFEGPSGVDSVTSLERALDQAMDRQSEAARHRLPRRQRSAAAAEPAAQLALADQPGALQLAPARLRWRGIEVSDEFQRYAERVARGEDLPPWRGPILAEPCAEFPWGSAPVPRTGTERLPTTPVGAPWLRAAGALAVTSLLVVAGALAIVRARPDARLSSQISAASTPPAPSLSAGVAGPNRAEDEPIATVLQGAGSAARGGTAPSVAPQPPRRSPPPSASPAPAVSVPLTSTARSMADAVSPVPPTAAAPAPRPPADVAKLDAPAPRRSENPAPQRVSPLLVEAAPF